jgi:hypothetical protein
VVSGEVSRTFLDYRESVCQAMYLLKGSFVAGAPWCSREALSIPPSVTS